jgi:hypothetical protein
MKMNGLLKKNFPYEYQLHLYKILTYLFGKDYVMQFVIDHINSVIFAIDLPTPSNLSKAHVMKT